MKTLFVPTDLSSHSLVALKYALELSKEALSRKLVYFHLNPQVISAEVPVLYYDDLKRINQELKEHLEKELQKHIADAGIGVGVLETEVIVTTEGGAISAIPHHAKKCHADLIVMGTHGKSGFEKFLLGSVTAGVLETSKIPVLAVPKHYKYEPVERIAFSSSFSSFTNEIKTILPFCHDLKATLEVIHVDYGLLSEKLIEHAKRVIADINHFEIDLSIVPGNVEDKLIDILKRHIAKTKPQWLVMIPKKMEWYEKLFLSSKSLELASDYNKPVLIIHPEGR
jgi:nucleotide-binding universal stress UspA family protein